MSCLFSTIFLLFQISKAETHVISSKIPPNNTGLYINEFMASNQNISIPGYSGNEDWIEIINTTNAAINLSGYYITDNLEKPTKFKLPTSSGSLIVPANGYLVLICSGNPQLGKRHLGFSLSASGEQIGLYMPDGETEVDTLTFGEQMTDVSMGRNPGNFNEWIYFKNPTPGIINDMSDAYTEILPPPVFSHKGGLYSNSFDLSLSTTIPGATIYYTLDGSEPDPDNTGGSTYQYQNEINGPKHDGYIFTYEYTSAIPIYDRTIDTNGISLISSSYYDNDGLEDLNFYFPSYNIPKGTIVKAIVHKPEALSITKANSYLVSLNHHYPIISLGISADYLFDYDNGIYTPGRLSEGGKLCDGGNYDLDFRYPASYEYFKDSNQEIAENVSFKIHGGCTRIFPQKSLKIYGNSKFSYPFFDETPELNHPRFIIRNGGNNWMSYLPKDAIHHEIARGLNVGLQNNNPTIVYLNGEYWGIHNMREKIDKYYINTLYNIATDSIDLIKTYYNFEAKEGDITNLNNLLNYVRNNKFGDSFQSNYESLLNKIDIESFIDYYIFQSFIANADWPHNNVRMWRKRVNGFDPDIEGYHDGRWRWIVYDTDIQYYYADENMFQLMMDNTHDNTLIFKEIKDNTSFKNDFSVRYSDLLNTSFLTNRITQIIDSTKTVYELEMSEHRQRWKKPEANDWNSQIESHKNYFTNRTGHVRDQLKSFFSLGNSYTLTVDVADITHGYIKVNTVDILPVTPGVNEQPYPWSGIYFQGLINTITAKPYKGYKFLFWLKNGQLHSYNESISFDLTSNSTYKAVFEEAILSDDPFPIAKILDECGYSFTYWSENSQAGTYPDYMSFVYFLKQNSNNEDHFLGDELGGLYAMGYKNPSKNRIDGLNENGISFINTGSDLDGIPDAKLGGAILALNTVDQDSVFISWTGGTVLKNDRKYRIRLQYRVGDILDFNDLLDESGQIIEYKTNDIEGHYEIFKNIVLPPDALNQPYVQLLWRYYYAGNKTSGKRSQLRLDDITVSTSMNFGKAITQSNLIIESGIIFSEATIAPPGNVEYTGSRSITLNPGFNTEDNAVFKAEVRKCD